MYTVIGMENCHLHMQNQKWKRTAGEFLISILVVNALEKFSLTPEASDGVPCDRVRVM